MATKEGNEVFKVPIGRAPQAKRGSLPAIEISKAARPGEQGRIKNHDVPASRSFTNLLQVKDGLSKTLSASNLAALSDSNLSIQEAVPARSYDAPYTSSHIAKQTFEQYVKQYYYQLTEGCGNDICQNQFCFSSQECINLTPALALMFSIELAASNRACLCKKDNSFYRPLPKPEIDPDSIDFTSPPFIYALYSSTPFETLYTEGSRPPSRSSLQLLLPSPLHHSRIGSLSLSPSLENLAFTYSRGKVDTSNVKSGAGFFLPTASDSRGRIGAADDSIVGQGVKPRSLCRQLSNSLGNLAGSSEFASYGSFSNVLNYSLSQIRLQNALVVPSRSASHSSLNEVSSVGSDTLHFDPSVDGDFGDNYEDLERQLQLELSYGRMQEFSLTHLTIPMLQCALEKFSETLDPSFLLNTIRTVFTSSESLNNSFKKEESLPVGPKNIALKDVRLAYELLMKEESLVPSLRNSIEILLSQLPNIPVQPQEVNQLAIILECPLFRKRRNHALRQKLCVVLSGLQPLTREAFCEVLLMYSPELFEKRMGMLKDHLMLSLRPHQRSEPQMVAMAETLSIFYQANKLQEKKTGKSVIPYRMFYVGELGRKLDYKTEYECWCKCHLDPVSPSSSHNHPTTSLLHYSFLLDPSSKVHALHLDAVIQMRRVYQEAILHQARVNQVQKYLRDFSRCPRLPNAVKSAMCPYLVLDIRRDHLIEDTISQIRLKEVDLKKPLKIKYIGGGEQGLDMGGLQKEFFQLVCSEIFDRDYGMFIYSEETRNLWINGASLDSDEEFELVGILLGLAIYNGIILDIRLPLAIYKKLQSQDLGLSDLEEVDPVIYRSLVEMLQFEGDVEDTFAMTFQVSTDWYGVSSTYVLIPNGADVAVTNENRHQYVKCYTKYFLTRSIEKQFNAFSRGFHKVCDSRVLSLFRPEEIELLVCGSPDFDFDAFERSASYDDGYHKEHRVVKWFWLTVHQMTAEQKRQLLHFITGSDRVPLKGLSHLPIIVQRNGSDSDRLPAAMTCFNRLLLPEYSSEEKLREKITIAIENGKGFGLQ